MSAQRALGSTVGFAVLGSILAAALTATLSAHLASALPDPTERKTILFVTHDIEEAVQLADRIFVFTKRPATLQKILNVDLPRPRDLDSPSYLRKRDEIFRLMGMSSRIGEAVAVS